jgi:hypothetical protein
VIHAAINGHNRLPSEHLGGRQLPRQAREETGFAAAFIQVHWQKQHATCPARRTSVRWTPAVAKLTNEEVTIERRGECSAGGDRGDARAGPAH